MIEHLSIPTEVGIFDARAAGPEDGRPVLLLHGFPESSAEWDFVQGALGGAECRAVAPDQRGYSPGVRPADVVDYRLDELVADVLRIADALGLDRFDLVGHDWGATVAWATAGNHPERVRTLTAVSVPHPVPFRQAMREDEDQHQRSTYIQLFQHPGTAEKQFLANDGENLRRIYDRRVPQTHVDDYVARFSEPGALTAALNWYRALGKSTLDVGAIEVPTLFVWSTEDVAIGSAAAFATEKHVTGPYRFEMLQDVSHWVPEEAGGELTAHIMRHLLDNPA